MKKKIKITNVKEQHGIIIAFLRIYESICRFT